MKNFREIIMIAAAATLFASCSQDDGAGTLHESSLLTLSAQTGAPQTRATSDGTWTGGETVRVNVNGTPYDFTAATDGTLTCASQYWNDYASVDAFAWYPATYAYPADQSGGIQAADFIFAEQVTGITQSTYNTTKKLTFRHKTAKVTATLTAGAGITSVTGATVKFYGYTEVDAIDSTGVSPTGAITGKTPGWITPDGANTALLVPKSYAGENVLKVTLAGKDYFWKPASLNLEAGKSYTFDITVENNVLTVTVTGNGAQWDAGSTSDVTAVRTHIRDIPVAFIPKGTFQMGSPVTEPNRSSNETQHQVTLTQDFYMSRYEITNAQYAAFLNDKVIGSNGTGNVTYYYNNFNSTVTESRTFISPDAWGVTWDVDKWVAQTGYGNHPVINVSWFGAKAFADWAGGSLPTEAQWEYACRAGTSTAYSYGASADGGYMWYNVNSGSSTHAVGTTTSGSGNAWGLYDMHGNVFEWCSDWYGTYDSSATDPKGSAQGSFRVLRGGDWDYYAQNCRSAFRSNGNPGGAFNRVGFRVVFVP